MSLFRRLFRKSDIQKPSANASHQTASWPFDQAANAAAITTRQVLEGGEQIHVVVHYSDDHSWAFLCGTTDAAEDGRVITMADAVGVDETIASIADLPPGWKAWREHRAAEWQRAENHATG